MTYHPKVNKEIHEISRRYVTLKTYSTRGLEIQTNLKNKIQ